MPINRLKQLREENGLSQIELGNRLGVTQQSVFAWERGKTSPQIQTAITLSQMYGVSLDYLLGLSDDPKTKKELADMSADELRTIIINQIHSLSDPELLRMYDFLAGLQAGAKIAEQSAAADNSAAEPAE